MFLSLFVHPYLLSFFDILRKNRLIVRYMFKPHKFQSILKIFIVLYKYFLQERVICCEHAVVYQQNFPNRKENNIEFRVGNTTL